MQLRGLTDPARVGRGRRGRQLCATLLAVCCLVLLAGQPAAGAPASGPAGFPMAEWTVLIYMAANNNLERAALFNLNQIGSVGSTDRVQVVVQVARPDGDGSQPGVLNLQGWGGVRRLHAEPGAFRELADLGDVDMTNPATLRDFIVWARGAFPAKRYALVLWDHGGAWRGYGLDASSDQPSPMSLPDLAGALRDGGAFFDFLGFDACLMASVEVALELQPYAGVLAASEELEPGRGWDYRAMLGALVKSPDLSGLDLGKGVADGYLANLQANVTRQSLYATLSVTDLTRMPEVAAALTRFSADLSAYVSAGAGSDPSEPVTRLGRIFGQARRQSPAFGRLAFNDPGLGLDLGEFARNAARITGDARLARDAAALQTALAAAVPYAVAGDGVKAAGLSGLTIFVPALPDQDSAYGPPGMRATKWPELVQVARAVAAQDGVPPRVAPPQLDTALVTVGGNAATLRGEVTDDTLVTGVMIGVVRLPVGVSAGDPILMAVADQPRTYAAANPYSYRFDGRGWFLADAGGRQPVFTVQWQPGRRAVFGRYRQSPGARPVDAYFVYDESTGDLVEGFEVTGGMLGALLPSAESRFRPFLYTVDLKALPGREVSLQTATLRQGALPDGIYLVTVTGFDPGGHSATSGALLVVHGGPGAGSGAGGGSSSGPAPAPAGEDEGATRSPGGRGCLRAGRPTRPCPQ